MDDDKVHLHYFMPPTHLQTLLQYFEFHA